jgi:hypothetical protein
VIPYYRKVEYADDGCDEFECLSCYARWVLRGGALNYCSNCGLKWKGRYSVGYIFDRERRYGLRRFRIEKAREEYYRTHSYERRSSFWWLIESRSCWKGQEPKPWEAMHCYSERAGAARVLDSLRMERAGNEGFDDYWHTEYRVRTVREKPKCYEACPWL